MVFIRQFRERLIAHEYFSILLLFLSRQEPLLRGFPERGYEDPAKCVVALIGDGC